MKLLEYIKNNKLVKSGLSYSLASTLSTVVTMIVGFVNMRWLGPELLGIWQSLLIVNAYLPFLQLGIQSGLNLELPIELGRGDTIKASSLVATAKSFAIILSLLLLVAGAVVITVLITSGADLKVVFGAVAIVIMAIVQCFRLHFVATYRSSRAFDKLSKIYLIDSLVNLILVFFIYKFQYYGLLIYNVLGQIITTSLMYYYAPYRSENARFNKKDFIILFKRGMFMSVFNQIKSVINSFPRVLILYLGGVVQVGLFTPALSVGHFINMLPGQLAQFIVPQMGYKYGKDGKASEMWKYLKKITIYMPLMILPFSILGWFIIPYVLEYIFPKYIESLWPIRVMLFGFVFSLKIAYNALITIKAYREVLLLQGVDAFCLLIIPYAIVKMGVYTMAIDMSIGLSIGYFVSYFVNYWVVKRTLFLPKYN